MKDENDSPGRISIWEKRRRAKKRGAHARRVALIVFGLFAVLAVLAYFRWAPDRYHLLRPIDLSDRPNFVTGWKLRLSDSDSCFEALATVDWNVTPLPDASFGAGCGFEDVGLLDRGGANWGQEVKLTCPMLARLALWERHTLQVEAKALLDSPVAQVIHFGTYYCRNINSAKSGRRSEHATANAIDIAAFILADGREISIQRDWDEGGDVGRFLRRLHRGACRHFQTVLGPEYNALHHDHFHFDQGWIAACR